MTALGIQSADVADPDAVSVVVQTMSPYGCLRPSTFDGAVESDHIVITATFESPIAMPAVDVGYRVVDTLRCGRTMQDDKTDGAHISGVLRRFQFIGIPFGRRHEASCKDD